MYIMNKARDTTMIPVKSISTIATLTPIATPEIKYQHIHKYMPATSIP